MPRPYRIAVENLGCRVNRYESDAVLQQFRAAGCVIVPAREAADAYLVNTCAVTQEAERKSGQMLRRAKRRGDGALVIAMGCQQALEGQHPDADYSVGNRGKNKLVAFVLACLDAREGGKPLPEGTGLLRLEDPPASGEALGSSAPATCSDFRPEGMPDGKRFAVFEDFGPVSRQSETRAFVKIQDGCNQFCSYCSIPYARGRVSSRDAASVLREIRALAETGYQEISLTGIHVCSYYAEHGRDSLALMDLCDAAAEITGIRRIRFGSVEPLSVSDAFIERYARNPKLCRHLHLSLQSGSDSVLRRMRRSYTTAEYAHVVAKLRERMPDFHITTDIIAGFPGETEEEHQETLAFCRACGLGRMHVFRYAARPMTAAARMPDQVRPQVAARRAAELAALSRELQEAALRRRLGQMDEILLEQCRNRLVQGRKQLFWEGYENRYMPCLLPASPPAHEAATAGNSDQRSREAAPILKRGAYVRVRVEDVVPASGKDEAHLLVSAVLTACAAPL